MQGRNILVAAVAAVAVMLVPASAAHATLSVTATGDDGQPAALTVGAPLALRMMDQKVIARVDKAEGYRWTMTVLDPSGVAATYGSPSCYRTEVIPEDSDLVIFRGNGTYRVVIGFSTDTTDTTCAKITRQVEYQFSVNSSVALGQPAGPVLTRQPNSYSTITQLLAFSGNPGAITYEIRYAKGGVLAADGSISGPVGNGYVDSATGQVQLIGLREPGSYLVVARAKNGDYYSPWSAPVTLTLLAPFDMTGISTLDRKGPSYKLRGTLGEPSAGGRVTISIAKGKTGKRFRVLGKPKVNSKGQWTLRFTVRKYGWYRMRYSYKGSATVAKGTIYATARIRKVFG